MIHPRGRGELLEQVSGDAASLLVVGDGERHLRDGRMARRFEIVSNRDNSRSDLTNDPEVVNVIDMRRRVHEGLIGRAHRKEARMTALGRKRFEKHPQPLIVLAAHRADAKRATGPQYDIRFEMRGITDFGLGDGHEGPPRITIRFADAEGRTRPHARR